jgi:hypothetical protein
MLMGKYDHTTLYVSESDKASLEQIARELGYVQTRGAGAGRIGSISALVCAIARREIALVPAHSQTDAGDAGRSEEVITEAEERDARKE